MKIEDPQDVGLHMTGDEVDNFEHILAEHFYQVKAYTQKGDDAVKMRNMSW